MFEFFQGFGVTFSTMFKKVVTEEYPEDFPPAAPRYHGRHQLNRHPDGLEKCVGCELCAWACPADAIYVEGGDNTEEARYSPGERYGAIYQINYLRCIGCGLCVEACPTRSLTMTNFYEMADDNRQDLIYTKEQLLAPLLPGMEQPPHPMRLGDSEQDYYVQGPELARPEPRARPGGGAGHMTADVRLRGGDIMNVLAQAAGAVSTGEAITFWILGPIALAGALGMVFARNAVHSALMLVVTMFCLAVFYIAGQAPFLGFVQIIVYTGAVMMLFLFVLMLVGRDSSDSVVEVLRGQRLAGLLLGVGLARAAGRRDRRLADRGHPGRTGRGRGQRRGGNVTGIGQLVFTRYLFAFELTSALLITAALGAMVLTYGLTRGASKPGQRATVEARLRGEHDRISPLPGPGVYATGNSVAVPAVLPDGSIAPESLSAIIDATPSRAGRDEHPVDPHALTGGPEPHRPEDRR